MHSDENIVLTTPEQILDCLGRISDTRIAYQWHGDNKLSFEIFSHEAKIEYFKKIANIIIQHINTERKIEATFTFQTVDQAIPQTEIKASLNYMPNKTINRLIMIFQSADDLHRLLRFQAGEGILQGHRYFEPDPDIVRIECSSLSKSFQICSKAKNPAKITNIFELNANCLAIPEHFDQYKKVFSNMPAIIKSKAIISLVRLNAKQKTTQFNELINLSRTLTGRAYLSLSIDNFLDRMNFFEALNADGYIFTAGSKEMNKKEKASKIQQIIQETSLKDKCLFLFYGNYTKDPSLVNGATELLYVRKFET